MLSLALVQDQKEKQTIRNGTRVIRAGLPDFAQGVPFLLLAAICFSNAIMGAAMRSARNDSAKGGTYGMAELDLNRQSSHRGLELGAPCS
jgi:hypothetical protein